MATATVHTFALRSQQVARTYHSRCVLPCAPIFVTLVTAISLLLLLWIDAKFKPVLEVAAAMCLIFTVQGLISLATPVAVTLLGRLRQRDEVVGMSALEVAMHQAVPWRLWTRFRTRPLGVPARDAILSLASIASCAQRTLVVTVCVLFATTPVLIAGVVWREWSSLVPHSSLLGLAVVVFFMWCCSR